MNICTLPADYEPDWRQLYPLTEYGKMMAAYHSIPRKPRGPSRWRKFLTWISGKGKVTEC